MSMTAIDQIERDLTAPSPDLVDEIARLDGDITVLGVGGKVGPSVAVMAQRAIEEAGVDKSVYGVARFSDPAAKGPHWSWAGVADGAGRPDRRPRSSPPPRTPPTSSSWRATSSAR